MNEHIARSGKSISNTQHHSVPTSLRKAKTFLEDEYLREITAASDDCCFYFQAKCCHSFRKDEPQHQLKQALCIFRRDVRQQLYVCCRKGWILQPYFSLDVQNLQVYPLWSEDYQGSMSRKGRECSVGVYISASKMAQKRRRRKHSSPASYGGLCYQNEAWWAQ